MNHRKLDILNQFLVTQLNHWSFFSIILTVTGLTHVFTGAEYPPFVLWTLCGLLPFLLFLARERIHRFLPFLLVHLAASAMFFFVPAANIVDKILIICFGVFYTIYSLYLHFAPGSDGRAEKIFPVIVVVVSAASRLLENYQAISFPDMYYTFPLILVLALYFISYYLERYMDFVELNTGTAGYLPEREMFRSGIRPVLLATLGTSILLFFTANLGWLSNISHVLKELFKYVLRLLFSLLLRDTKEEEILIEEAAKAPGPERMELPEAGESFWLWDFLFIIAQIAVLAFAAYLAFKALRRLIRYLREHFLKDAFDKIDETADVYDIREKCDITSAGRKRTFRDIFKILNPGERIRRYYKIRVLSEKKLFKNGEDTSNLALYTARECGEKIGVPEMAEIYERARYGKEDVSVEDVKRMREICRRK